MKKCSLYLLILRESGVSWHVSEPEIIDVAIEICLFISVWSLIVHLAIVVSEDSQHRDVGKVFLHDVICVL